MSSAQIYAWHRCPLSMYFIDMYCACAMHCIDVYCLLYALHRCLLVTKHCIDIYYALIGSLLCIVAMWPRCMVVYYHLCLEAQISTIYERKSRYVVNSTQTSLNCIFCEFHNICYALLGYLLCNAQMSNMQCIVQMSIVYRALLLDLQYALHRCLL